jgi:hypothetical protein
MNERIKELAKQADEGYTGDSRDDMGASLVGNDAIEKFAELIVKECMRVVIQSHKGHINPSLVIEPLKEHFGDEE